MLPLIRRSVAKYLFFDDILDRSVSFCRTSSLNAGIIEREADFVCVQCGYSNNTGLVGAINMETRGHRESACEVNGAVMPSVAETRRQ